MSHALSLQGVRSGSLVAVRYARTNKHNKRIWECQCDCGGIAYCTASAISHGIATNCGCKRKESLRATFTTHGHTINKIFTPTYSSWTAMLSRCNNKNSKAFQQYGGKGITVCDRWFTFENFLADMGERPEGMTLDRFPNNKGNYEPGNCRWATCSDQNMNKECNPHFELNGKCMTLRGWATELGLDRTTLQKRIYKLGWLLEKALSPCRHGRWGKVADGMRPGRHAGNTQ